MSANDVVIGVAPDWVAPRPSALRAVGLVRGPSGGGLPKGGWIVGAERAKLAAELRKRYDKGARIRELAADVGRYYGFVHRVISESGVAIRTGGGGVRRSRKA